MSVVSRLTEANRLLQLNQINPQILSKISAEISTAVEQLNIDAIDIAADVAALNVDVRFSGLYIPAPAAALNADFSAATLVDPVTQVTPTVTRKFNPRNALTSMRVIILKTNTALAGITIDVTTGGTTDWTTPAGLNTDYTLFGSGNAAAGSWLVRIDLPNKIVLCSPVA